MRFDFKLGKYYNVTYNQSMPTIKHGKRVREFVELTLRQVMFYKSTPCFYVFYANKQLIKIKQEDVLDYNEI